MAVHQDIDKGTIRMDMEMAITKLCMGLLTKEELAKAAHEPTPMLVTPLTRQTSRTVPKDSFNYLSVVGSLMHIAYCVRCDISYAVGVLARHASCPGPTHVRAAKRVLQYLFSTRTLGITFTKPISGASNPIMYEGASHPLDNGLNRLQVFADSDYAADQSRRSTMGSILMMNGGPVSRASILVKAQAESGLQHVRNAKHYEIHLRFLQEPVVDKRVGFTYCPTDVQLLADFLTKPLDSNKFQRLFSRFHYVFFTFIA
eukprot:CAMPEP_0171711892 /NCGR_PEP_ID=MMETSP0991-20121206/16858_1 /TAXON_ID=483369 /ORGANISM="non described non described, Strain CCMP2098" /LENGTH=257 /DNA_ID=CAMNT_0012302305 /DNA_START=203 /DNA_END=974 /DNA_ORIENTATION=+